MNDILRESLNRGAPIDAPVLINLVDYFEIFKSQELHDEFREAVKKCLGGISNIAKFHVGDIFVPALATITLGENNIKELRFSGENVFTCIREIFDPLSLKEIIDICE